MYTDEPYYDEPDPDDNQHGLIEVLIQLIDDLISITMSGSPPGRLSLENFVTKYYSMLDLIDYYLTEFTNYYSSDAQGCLFDIKDMREELMFTRRRIRKIFKESYFETNEEYEVVNQILQCLTDILNNNKQEVASLDPKKLSLRGTGYRTKGARKTPNRYPPDYYGGTQ